MKRGRQWRQREERRARWKYCRKLLSLPLPLLLLLPLPLPLRLLRLHRTL